MPLPGAEGAGQRTNTQGLPDPPCRLCPVLGTAGATRAAETRRLPCEQLPLQLELPKFLPASIHTQHVPQLPGGCCSRVKLSIHTGAVHQHSSRQKVPPKCSLSMAAAIDPGSRSRF
ncbi:hypothetical protein J1605_020456 [Eschrichtius robustus]|uniref:Uncharacterized protein n=1 Tax=Eschrichtius robustus TaxID=9764 RepID=A0AB34HMJ3_ESCRO|nr:hypothetical protein J1605_020456 [Eschrichtius robustus]